MCAVADLAQQPEAPPYSFGVVGEQRQGHEPTQAQRGIGGQLSQEPGGDVGGGVEPELGLLGGGVDLHVDVQPTPRGLQPAIECFGDRDAVQCLELGGERRDVTRLVGLQMPDHRPLDAQVGQVHVLALGLLHLVLTQLRAPPRGDREVSHGPCVTLAHPHRA